MSDISPGEIAKFENRFCPESEFKDELRLTNQYSNSDVRDSMQVELVMCKDGNNGVTKCRDDGDKLLKAVFFTLYDID